MTPFRDGGDRGLLAIRILPRLCEVSDTLCALGAAEGDDGSGDRYPPPCARTLAVHCCASRKDGNSAFPAWMAVAKLCELGCI